MAELQFKGETVTGTDEISAVMNSAGIPYERWGTRLDPGASDEEILTAYDQDVTKLKNAHGYVTADLIALNPDTPNLDTICKKFVDEHHHTEDEVRFVVEGEGVFEIFGDKSDENVSPLKFKAQAGDLIVIPANRRHLFYLTDKKTIRCIRLFKTIEGWEALYDKNA